MNTRYISDILYDFKKDYPIEVKYITIDSSTYQVETGNRDIPKTFYYFTAVMLPQSLARKFIQDIGYLAANKNFTYGGLNDFNTLIILVRACDFPSNLKPDLDGYCILNKERYSKVTIGTLGDAGYIIALKRIMGDFPFDMHKVLVEDSLDIQENFAYELN